jgi:hypothetical protein
MLTYKLPIEKSVKSWLAWSPEYADHLVDQNFKTPNAWVRKKLIAELWSLEDQANVFTGRQTYNKARELVKNLIITLPDIQQQLAGELEQLESRIEREKTVMTQSEFKTAVHEVKAYKNVLGKIEEYTKDGLN